MPNSHETLTSLFSDIADAIRAKTGNSGTIVADNFPTAIANIPSGGGSGPSNVKKITGSGYYDSITQEITLTISTGKESHPNYAIIKTNFSQNSFYFQIGGSSVYKVNPSSEETASVTSRVVNYFYVYDYVFGGEQEASTEVTYEAYFIY